MKQDAPLAEALEGTEATQFDVAECRYDSTGKITEVILQLEDGRMVPAKLADKLELVKGDVLKTSTVTVKDGIVTKVAR